MGRLLSLVALALILSSVHASALELSWPSGQRNIQVTSSAPCSLFVRSTPGDSISQGAWRFVWIGTAEVDSPFVVVPTPATPELASPDVVAPGPTVADGIDHSTLALFHAPTIGPRPQTAMYQLRLHPSLRATLMLAPFGTSERDWGRDTLGVLTINGGSDVPLPPIVSSAQVNQHDSAPSPTARIQRMAATSSQAMELQGIGFGAISVAYVLRAGSNIPEPAVITSQTDTMLVVEVPPDLGTTPSVLVVQRSDGVAAAVPLTLTLTEDITQPYHYAIAADGASIGQYTTSPLTTSPADGSWALHYRTWADGAPHYYSLQQGAYLREMLPSNVPEPQRCGLAIDGNGTTHVVGRAIGRLAHAWRAQGDTAWSTEAVPGTTSPGDYVLRVDPLSNDLELVYMKLEAGQYVLCWTRRVDGAWTYPEQIEDRVGDLSTCAFTIDQDGIDRVADVFRPFNSDTAWVYYRTRISRGGPWAEPDPVGPVAMPIALSIVMDPIAESPEITFLDYDWEGYQDVFLANFDGLGGWSRSILWWANSIWDARLTISADGVTHLVVFEAPSASDSGCVYHRTRFGTVPGGFRDWQEDTVVTSGGGMVPGQVRLPIDLTMQGEAPLIAFGCGLGSLYVASPQNIAAVSAVANVGLSVRGPWPNPTRNGRVGRMALTAGRQSTCECSLFDVTGKCIRREQYELALGEVKWVTLGAEALPSGMYFVRVRSAHERDLVQKWVVFR